MSSLSQQLKNKVYGDFESYHFETTSWEAIDPETFSLAYTEDETTTATSQIETFVLKKIKLQSYLSFFAQDAETGRLWRAFSSEYDRELGELIKTLSDANAIRQLAGGDKTAGKKQPTLSEREQSFSSRLDKADRHLGDFYRFFIRHTDLFDMLSKGFVVELLDGAAGASATVTNLTEAPVITGSKRSLKIFRKKNDAKALPLRVFPLLKLAPGFVHIYFVAVVNGELRTSIDYLTGTSPGSEDVFRFYLPHYKFSDALFTADTARPATGGKKPHYEGITDFAKSLLTEPRKIVCFQTNVSKLRDASGSSDGFINFEPGERLPEKMLRLSPAAGRDAHYRGIAIY